MGEAKQETNGYARKKKFGIHMATRGGYMVEVACFTTRNCGVVGLVPSIPISIKGDKIISSSPRQHVFA